VRRYLTSSRLLQLLLLLLLLLMACAPSRHRERPASATELSGTVESVDRGSASVVPKISSRSSGVPGQSSQCSSVCGAWPHLGQSGSTGQLLVLLLVTLYPLPSQSPHGQDLIGVPKFGGDSVSRERRTFAPPPLDTCP